MRTIDVVAAIIKQGDRILATQRGYGDFAGGWEFPGGKIEQGEAPEQAIVREIHEELEAFVAVDSLITVVDYDYSDFHLHMYCFLCHVVNGELELHEHMAARWLDADSIDSVAWLPADELVIQAIKDQAVLGAGNRPERPKRQQPNSAPPKGSFSVRPTRRSSMGHSRPILESGPAS